MTKSQDSSETISKTILDEKGVSYDNNTRLLALVNITLKELKLVPQSIDDEVRSAETIRILLGKLASISQSLTELRNPYGTGHGKGASHRGLQPRHARLAVAAAFALGCFMFESFKERDSN